VQYELLISIARFDATLFPTAAHTTCPYYPLLLHLQMADTWFGFVSGCLAAWVALLCPCFQPVRNQENRLNAWAAKPHAGGLKREHGLSRQNTATEQGCSAVGSDPTSRQCLAQGTQWGAKEIAVQVAQRTPTLRIWHLPQQGPRR
ncbi:hypothetical protein GQ54DRAFT_325588, partial [Martensiomyces pterosporus]